MSDPDPPPPPTSSRGRGTRGGARVTQDIRKLQSDDDKHDQNKHDNNRHDNNRHDNNRHDNQHDNNERSERGRGGRGRGGRGRGRGRSDRSPSYRPIDGETRDIPSTSTSDDNIYPHNLTMRQVEEQDMKEVWKNNAPTECLLCAHPLGYVALTDCLHSSHICGACVLRLRLFMEKKPTKEEAAANIRPPHTWECPFCRASWSRVIITRLNSSLYNSLPEEKKSISLKSNIMDELKHDDDVDIYFEDDRLLYHFLKMRSIYCTLCDHTKPKQVKWFRTVKLLDNHLAHHHGRHLCDACISSRKVFIDEQRTYTKMSLLQHFRDGTRATTTDPYVPPHPFCQFHNTPFFSNDELYAHLTQEHRTCRFCQEDGIQKYFRNDDALLRHLSKHHYVCNHPACENKSLDVVAFRDIIALKAHELAVHVDKSTLTKQQLKNLSTVDVGFFTGSAVSVDEHHGSSRSRRTHDADEFEFKLDAEYQRADREQREYHEAQRRMMNDDAYPALSSIEQRARAANDDIRQRGREQTTTTSASTATPTPTPAPSTATSSTPVPTPVTRPTPAHTGPTAANIVARSLAATNPNDFPELIGRPSTSTSQPFGRVMGAGAKPTAADFPSLGGSKPKPTNKSVPTQAASISRTPAPTTSTPHTVPTTPMSSIVDTRTNPNVPLPLPPPCPVADAPLRNKIVIGGLRDLLSPAQFESFRRISSEFRAGTMDAATYYQQLMGMLDVDKEWKRVETLLMELISLLPDESKRTALHAEYAKQKVLSTLHKNKNSFANAAANSKSTTKESTSSTTSTTPSSSSSSSSSSSTSTSTSTSTSSTLSEDDGWEKPTSTAPAPKKKRVMLVTTFKRNQPAVRQTFNDDRTVVEKKKDDDDIWQVDKAALEAEAERERKAKIEERERRNAEMLAQKQAAAEAKRQEEEEAKRIAAEAAAKKKAEEAEKRAQQRIEEEKKRAIEEQERKQRIAEREAALAEGRRLHAQNVNVLNKGGKKNQAWVETTPVTATATPAAASAWNPVAPVKPAPIPSSSTSTSASTYIPDPSVLHVHVSVVAELELPPHQKQSLEFLVMLLSSVIDTLTHRHPDWSHTSVRRHHLSHERHTHLESSLRHVKYAHALEWGRIGRAGLSNTHVQTLSSMSGMYTRYGQESMQEWIMQGLQEMSSSDLFLIFDYCHILLTTLTSPNNAELQTMLSAWSQRQRENEKLMPKAVEHKKSDDDEDVYVLKKQDSNDGTREESNQNGGGGGGKKKKNKQKMTLLKFG